MSLWSAFERLRGCLRQHSKESVKVTRAQGTTRCHLVIELPNLIKSEMPSIISSSNVFLQHVRPAFALTVSIPKCDLRPRPILPDLSDRYRLPSRQRADGPLPYSSSREGQSIRQDRLSSAMRAPTMSKAESQQTRKMHCRLWLH